MPSSKIPITESEFSTSAVDKTVEKPVCIAERALPRLRRDTAPVKAAPHPGRRDAAGIEDRLEQAGPYLGHERLSRTKYQSA
jgi:hypothetical protein